MKISLIRAAKWAVDIDNPLEKVVTDDDVINQQIRLLLSLPKGSVPGNPEKGFDMEAIMDLPVYQMVPHLTKLIFNDVPKYIPKIDVVQAPIIIEESNVVIKVIWKYKQSGETGQTEVNYGR